MECKWAKSCLITKHIGVLWLIKWNFKILISFHLFWVVFYLTRFWEILVPLRFLQRTPKQSIWIEICFHSTDKLHLKNWTVACLPINYVLVILDNPQSLVSTVMEESEKLLCIFGGLGLTHSSMNPLGKISRYVTFWTQQPIYCRNKNTINIKIEWTQENPELGLQKGDDRCVNKMRSSTDYKISCKITAAVIKQEMCV